MSIKMRASGVNYILSNKILNLAVKTGQLSPTGTDYTLDYDNVIKENDKQDAARTKLQIPHTSAFTALRLKIPFVLQYKSHNKINYNRRAYCKK